MRLSRRGRVYKVPLRQVAAVLPPREAIPTTSQVVERYLTGKAGRSMQIEVPERAECRRRSPQWEARAILNLAKAGLQNGLQPDDAAHKKIYRRVAERARFLTFVPQNRRHEVVWYDEDE
jgi:hypothetical protein